VQSVNCNNNIISLLSVILKCYVPEPNVNVVICSLKLSPQLTLGPRLHYNISTAV
jgi:hypothetical protein